MGKHLFWESGSIARVVPNPGKSAVDEILVAPFTDPGWTPLFARRQW